MSGKKMQEISGIWADSLANSAQSPYIFLTGMSGIWAEKNARNERNLSGIKNARNERNLSGIKNARYERNLSGIIMFQLFSLSNFFSIQAKPKNVFPLQPTQKVGLLRCFSLAFDNSTKLLVQSRNISRAEEWKTFKLNLTVTLRN